MAFGLPVDVELHGSRNAAIGLFHIGVESPEALPDMPIIVIGRSIEICAGAVAAIVVCRTSVFHTVQYEHRRAVRRIAGCGILVAVDIGEVQASEGRDVALDSEIRAQAVRRRLRYQHGHPRVSAVREVSGFAIAVMDSNAACTSVGMQSLSQWRRTIVV